MSKFSYVSTGFTSGLGAIARPLVEKKLAGWHHVMLCRNKAKVATATNLTLIECNLSSIQSIKHAAKEITVLVESGKIPPLKYIFNNAGVSHINRLSQSEDGLEDTFLVNVAAVYILLKGLLPLLKKQPDGRVFVTGSNAHHGDKEHNHGFVPKPYWNDQNIDEVMLPTKIKSDRDKSLYSSSKLALNYLVFKFARENKDVKFIIYEPGFVPGTGLVRDLPWIVRVTMLKSFGVIFRLLGWAVTSEHAGEQMALNMLNDDLYEKANNVIYCDLGKVSKASEESYNEAREDQLWSGLAKFDY